MLNHDLFINDNAHGNVVLIHGLFGDKDNLTSVRRALNENFSVMSIDLPNHGNSLRISDWNLTEITQMLNQLFEHTHFKPDAILGHSLGGKVAMAYTLNYPMALKCAVVADIAPAEYPARHEKVFEALQAVPLDKIESRSDATHILNSILNETGTAQFLLKSLKRDNSGWRWAFNLKALKQSYSAISGWPFLQQSADTTILFVKGSKSDYLNESHKNSVNMHFKNSAVKVISGAGHWLHAEKPVLFNRIVTQFLQQQLM